MTQREFFNAVINANISADITKFAQDRVAHLDTVNANRKSKGTPVQRENAETMAKIIDTVKPDVPYTASELAKMFDISTAKASALAKKFVDNGQASVVQARVEKGKSKVNVYTFTSTPTVPEVEDNID